MDIINQETNYAQLVKVVNELKAQIETSENNPLNVILPSTYISSAGTQDRVRVSVSNLDNFPVSRPISSSTFILHISSVHVVNSGVGVVFPINLTVYNITASTVTNCVNSVYGTYSARFPSATSIVIFYETTSNTGLVEGYSYSSDD